MNTKYVLIFFSPKSDYVFKKGSAQIFKQNHNILAKNIFVHRFYKPNSTRYDIALVRLPELNYGLKFC